MKFRLAYDMGRLRCYHEFEAASEQEAQKIVDLVNAEEIDVDDVGELVHTSCGSNDPTVVLTDWRQ